MTAFNCLLHHTHVKLACGEGGGYKKKNVARCWAYETAVLVGQEHLVTDRLPENHYMASFGRDKDAMSGVKIWDSDRMHLDLKGKVENLNTKASLEEIRIKALEHLRHVQIAPGVLSTLLSAAFLLVARCLARKTTCLHEPLLWLPRYVVMKMGVLFTLSLCQCCRARLPRASTRLHAARPAKADAGGCKRQEKTPLDKHDGSFQQRSSPEMS